MISYSAYLWHFVAFSLARNALLEFTNLHKIILIALTLVLAVLSYFFIERPFRDKRRVTTPWLLGIITGATILTALLAVLVINGQIKNRQSQDLQALLDRGAYAQRHVGFELSHDFSVKDSPLQGLLVVGNSHGEDLYQALSASYVTQFYQVMLASPARRLQEVNYQISCFYRFVAHGDNTCKGINYDPKLSQEMKAAQLILLASRWNREDDLEVLPDFVA